MNNNIKVVKGKHNVKFEDLLKKLPNGKKVFDFRKIENFFTIW